MCFDWRVLISISKKKLASVMKKGIVESGTKYVFF
jgi:hypothetical protein